MAAASEMKSGVLKLNSGNYQIWKFGAEMLLLKEDLWTAIIEPKPDPVTGLWKRKNDAARATIALMVEPPLHHLINKSVTAKEMWFTIKEHYERIGFSAKIFLKKKLLDIKLEEYNMDKYIGDITSIIDRLKSGGCTYDDTDTISTLLCGLPSSYDSLIMGLEAREENSLSLELVKIKLTDEAERKKENAAKDSQQVLTTTTSGLKKFTMDNKKSIRCFNCNRFGHYQSMCQYKKHDVTSRLQQPRTNWDNNTSFGTGSEAPLSAIENNHTHIERDRSDMLEISEYLSYVTSLSYENADDDPGSSDWVLDSGATAHMCKNTDMLENFVEFKEHKLVTFANGAKSIAVGTGNMTVTSQLDDKYIENKINSVVYVPGLHVNLLSVSELCTVGYSLNFKNHSCIVEKEGCVVMTGNIDRGIFKAKLMYTRPDLVNTACIHTWHRRLGHRNINTIKKMSLENNLKIKIDSCDHNDICETCNKCNIIQKTYYSVKHKQSGKPFELIHGDLCGPISPTTRGGGNYILILTDDWTRYSYLEVLKYKSDAVSRIIKYIKHFTNKFGHSPTYFRTDAGGEFDNSTLNNFLTDSGIHHQFSAPHTPQQNGVSERVNWTIVRMMKSMLAENNLPRNLWGEAAATACYLHNRILHSSTGKIPYAEWEGRTPEYDHIRIMGSRAYSYKPKGLRGKLDNNADVGILLGYSDEHKAYKLLNTKDCKVQISSNANFDEDKSLSKESAIQSEEYYEYKPNLPDSQCDIAPEIEPNIPVRRSTRTTRGVAPERYDEQYSEF